MKFNIRLTSIAKLIVNFLVERINQVLISMKTSDFDYHLPESSIAQTPVEPRDSICSGDFSRFLENG